MNILGLGRAALGIGLTVAMLAGCGQGQTVGPGMMPQSAAPAGGGTHGKSWMLPEATSDDLLYSIGGEKGQYGYVRVLSLSKGNLVGEFWLDGNAYSMNVCADASGDVFFPAIARNTGQDEVLEYVHGGTTPVAILDDSAYPADEPFGCSVDPTTGDLAVANMTLSDYVPGDVAIYTGAQGTPRVYTNPEFGPYDQLFCTYDGAGNLFLDGFSATTLAELPRGSYTYKDVTADESIVYGQVGWDGRYIAVGYGYVYRLSVSGSNAMVVGRTRLRNALNGFVRIQNNIAIDNLGGHNNKSGIGIWHYPAGGHPYQFFNINKKKGGALSFAVSVAPSTSHIRK